jgi:hypothetical protein
MANIKIVRARTTEEYVNMIEQALDEVWDLRQAIEFDAEEMPVTQPIIEELETGLKAIYASMKDSSYQFATGELFFMEILNNNYPGMIPFNYLLLRINETHMKGLEIDS